MYSRSHSFYIFENFASDNLFCGIIDTGFYSKYNCNISCCASFGSINNSIYICKKISDARYKQQYCKKEKLVWKKIYKLYPSLLEENFEESSKGILDADKLLEEHGVIFASGINIDKLVWVLFISSLIGDIIETIYVFLVSHIFMRRSSLVLGPFSLVWGLGAVILTLALSRVKRQNNISIFISGFFFGGVFEYLCSVFTEVFFGMKFWDYSYMPFNIDGRTNLLFMFFWGIVALVWFRFIYPPLSKTIEKIPPVTGTVLAFIITAFFICNSMVTSMVMIRTTGRKKQPVARNVIEQFIDNEYPNDVVRKLWPNMNFLEE